MNAKITRFTDNGVMENDGSGWKRPTPVAFQVWTLIGGWRPVCEKHKKIFFNKKSYYSEHAHCKANYRNYPMKDVYLLSVPGYKRVWL